jgi:hypothetical protein
MRAQFLEDGTISVTGAKRKESFNKIWAGIGWPENESGYICVVGQRVDGRYHALWEKKGGLWEIGKASMEANNRLLVDSIWVDTRDAVATSYMRTLPGLCFSEKPAERSLTRAKVNCVQAEEDSSGAERVMATVVPVSERAATNYRSALEKARGVIMACNLLIHEACCPKLVYTLRQPLEDLLRSPVIKALVWVITAFEESEKDADIEPASSDQWYNNSPRGLP